MFSLLSPLALSSSSSSSSSSSDSSSSSSSHISLGIGETEGTKHDLHQAILRDEAVARLHELGQVSDAATHLERTFMSPASIRAIPLIRGWMEDAGLSTWVDYMGNVHGRVEPKNGSSQALLIGSHMDTVIDAGKYDGSLGIISAISALKVLKIDGRLGELKRPVEVIAFSDEEGVRFQSTFLGSAALAGIMPVSRLEVTDKSGISVQDALKENSIDITDENLMQLKYDPASVWGYVEVHIEQGPVLEWVGYPLGVVKGIAGQTRLKNSTGYCKRISRTCWYSSNVNASGPYDWCCGADCTIGKCLQKP